jgi:hypothetical protein
MLPPVRRLRYLPALGLLATLAALALSAAFAGASASRTFVASNCTNAAYKPRSVILACGDAGLAAAKLRWSRWGSNSAAGVGTGRAKICEPDCAAGKVATAKMRLVLSKPRLCSQDGKRHFTKIHYTWVDGAPAGTGPKQGTVPMPCSLL